MVSIELLLGGCCLGHFLAMKLQMMALIWSFLLFCLHCSISACGVVALLAKVERTEPIPFLQCVTILFVLDHLPATVMFSELAIDLALAVDLWPFDVALGSREREVAGI